jgi:hypothetical protein
MKQNKIDWQALKLEKKHIRFMPNSDSDFKIFKKTLTELVLKEAKRVSTYNEVDDLNDIIYLRDKTKQLQDDIFVIIDNKRKKNFRDAKINSLIIEKAIMNPLFDSEIQFLNKLITILSKNSKTGRPKNNSKVMFMLWYACFYAQYDKKKLIEIGQMIVESGKLNKQIDSRFGIGTYQKINMPSANYESDFDEDSNPIVISTRWLKPIKKELVSRAKEFFLEKYKKSNSSNVKKDYINLKNLAKFDYDAQMLMFDVLDIEPDPEHLD